MATDPTPTHRDDMNTRLRELWIVTQELFTEAERDIAQDAAIELLAGAGFDPDDSDRLGDSVSDVVQTLVTLAILRLPEVGDVSTEDMVVAEQRELGTD